jgi:hypothetical protein
MSRRSLFVRALRTRWWPRFMLAGALVAVVGITLLSGVVQAACGLGGVLVFLFALVRGLDSDDYYHRERPIPPGSGHTF